MRTKTSYPAIHRARRRESFTRIRRGDLVDQRFNNSLAPPAPLVFGTAGPYEIFIPRIIVLTRR
jgi:hypothetical protein